ncbi:MAG: peptidase [Prolixibacteraceae bacterium]|nr:peptidase [Prolixibacteraceae bacterium]
MNTRKISKFLWLSFFFVFIHSALIAQEETELYKQLASQPEFISVQKIDQYPFFTETYEILVDQYLDHGNPSAGKFIQRVVLSNYNKYSPVVFVTEGYHANYAVKDTYINELSKIIEANQVVVEHRYFGKSMPDNPNWDYLTIKNACADLHRIYKIIGRIYNNKNKWIATGISKGGQNTLAYKALYPDDMDIWIPYVAPNNFSLEEKRHSKFISSVGSKKIRQKIEDFQKDVLAGRDSIQPLLDSLIIAENFTFSIPNEKVLDYCVLEYSFSFWQWGNDWKTIPTDTATYIQLFKHLVDVCDPDYFAHEGIEPIKAFYIQAAKEIGYYVYDTRPFKGLLSINNSKGYFDEIFLPDDFTYKFDKSVSKLIEKAVNTDGEHILAIYGGNDPWTASSVRVKPSSDAVKMVIPGASHRVRINNMTYAQKGEVYILLEKWLEED